MLMRRKKKFKVIVDVVRQNSFSSRYIARNNSFASRCDTRNNASRSTSLRIGDKANSGAKGKEVRRSSSLRQPMETEPRKHAGATRNDSFRIWNKVAARRIACEP